jgi:hypothetical protein
MPTPPTRLVKIGRRLGKMLEERPRRRRVQIHRFNKLLAGVAR